MKKIDWVEFWAWAVVIALCMLIINLLTGCKVTEYIPVETKKKEQVYLDRLQVDTFLVCDSVIIKEKGDCEDKEHIRYIYKNKYLHDTTNIVIVDTLTQVVTIEKEKELSKIDNLCLRLGKFVFPILLLLLIAGGVYVYKKLRK